MSRTNVTHDSLVIDPAILGEMLENTVVHRQIEEIAATGLNFRSVEFSPGMVAAAVEIVGADKYLIDYTGPASLASHKIIFVRMYRGRTWFMMEVPSWIRKNLYNLGEGPLLGLRVRDKIAQTLLAPDSQVFRITIPHWGEVPEISLYWAQDEDSGVWGLRLNWFDGKTYRWKREQYTDVFDFITDSIINHTLADLQAWDFS